jgi:hypothetical protein
MMFLSHFNPECFNNPLGITKYPLSGGEKSLVLISTLFIDFLGFFGDSSSRGRFWVVSTKDENF